MEKREFKTGAVRDTAEEKGRCDLIPLEVFAPFFGSSIINNIILFKKTGDSTYLTKALEHTIDFCFGQSVERMLLELSVHMKKGSEHYGEDNWKKGIPLWSYIDSATRHYLMHCRGDKDENHIIAFVWNLQGAIWTCENIPQLNSYKGE